MRKLVLFWCYFGAKREKRDKYPQEFVSLQPDIEKDDGHGDDSRGVGGIASQGGGADIGYARSHTQGLRPAEQKDI